MPAQYPGNARTMIARAAAGGGFESDIIAPPAAGLTQRRITSPGSFGSGPNVILFDRFTGTHLEQLAAQRSADIGQWTSTSGGSADGDTWVPRLYEDRGRTWFSHRDPAYLDRVSGQFLTRCFLDFPASSEFRFSQRRWVPTDKHFPSAEAPGVFPTAGTTSVWKPTWLAGSDGTQLTGFGQPDNQADLVFDSHVSTGSISNGGNSSGPKSQAVGSGNGTFYSDFSFTAPTFSTFYQGGVESAAGVEDQTVNHIVITDTANRVKFTDLAAPFTTINENWATMVKAYSGMNFGGWVGNQASRAQNDCPLIADAYLALGANSQACILVSNATTLTASTECYIVPPDTSGWTDTAITTSLASYELLDYMHIIKADGTLLENVTWELV